MANPSHSVPPKGGQPDHGSMSGFLGQRKSRAGPGSAAGQGAGGPGGSQSPQQVSRQLGSDGDHGSRSDFRGQRKSRAGPGSAAGQDAGGPGGSQSPQQVTRQLGARKGIEKYVKEDISKDFPSLRKHVCTSSPESILNSVDDIMRKLAGCFISDIGGRLFLHFPAEKRDMAIAFCQHFEDMVGAAESEIVSLPSSTAHENEYDEILVNAAGQIFPEMLRKVRVKKNDHGKFVFTPALSKADHNLISGLQQSEVQVKDGEAEKAKTIHNAFPMDPDIYVEFLPSKKVVVVVVRKYDQMQTATSRIKVHLGQMKTAVRGRRQFTTQAGKSDLDVRGASAAATVEAAEEAVEEVTGADNKITLPGGLVVIPYRAVITKLKVDAIVNDANERLAHGGGVARAIADAAGLELHQECQDFIDLNGPVPVSGICITGPGRLPCTRVIHAVGPRWDSRTPEVCRQQLYNTVLNCCREADEWDLWVIAMPPISSGIFGMPKDQCTEMYCKALLDFDQQPNKKLKTVHFVDIKDDMPLALLKALRKEIGQGQHWTRPPEEDVDLSQGCVICTEKDFDQPVKLNGCNHVFCKACIEPWFQNKPTCPSCNKVCGIITGTMPQGTMTVSREGYIRLKGYESCGCIVINYSFHDGVQKAEHPNPGQPYRGTRRTAYLPDNAEGNKVLRLLQEAWNRKLTFTIGRSTITGRDNVVTWNDIHHKTSTEPGHPFGYPDPDYLTRVQEELAACGVTEESIKLAQSGNPQDFSQFYTPLRPTRASAAAAGKAAEETPEEATEAGNRIALPGGLVVIPYKGDITKLRVYAIVNDADEHLAHRGGVARAISVAAGPDFDQECQDYIALSGAIGVSEVCVTGPGCLPCNRVIHAVGPRWDSRTPELCRQQLYDTVLNCCREADKWDLDEIAMPPVSSGMFGMPQDQCTEMYCKALLDFDQQPNKKLKIFHFVDIKDDMPLALLKALRKEIGQGQQRTRPPEADVDLSQGCVICTEKDFDQPVKLNGCNHVFCKGCIELWFKQKPTCPSCNKVYGVITGTMPQGTMNVSSTRYVHLKGYESCGCIVINYTFYDGVQKAEHPNPGQPYRGARHTAYLPDNAEGNKVLRLLQEAWNRKLTFTISHSPTTGQENVVTWNDIHHKTSPSPGHPFGYPDSDYLTRVQEELAARGVTEESIKLAQSGNPQDFSQFYTPLRPRRPTHP